MGLMDGASFDCLSHRARAAMRALAAAHECGAVVVAARGGGSGGQRDGAVRFWAAGWGGQFAIFAPVLELY